MSQSRAEIKQRFGIIGNNERLNTAIDIAVQVAPTEVTVLIFGENGTGKDVFSKIIHQLSPRKGKTFIAVNCGAIPEGTIDSELFGHEKGSFTSAHDSRKGYFEEANGGVIFLDEIAEMPMPTQARLLRVLENGEYLRVGSSKVQKTDVRIVAATNKNLIEAIRQGKFREDLYFRLNTVTIQVPPLRERGDDIELLFRFYANFFGDRYGRQPIMLTPSASPLLRSYHWPGNVREMRNFVEKLTVLVTGKEITAETLSNYLPRPDSQLPILSPQKRTYEHHSETNGFGGQNDWGAGINSNDNSLILQSLFELKKEVSEMKAVIATLLQHQLQHVSSATQVVPTTSPATPTTHLPTPVGGTPPAFGSYPNSNKPLFAPAPYEMSNPAGKTGNTVNLKDHNTIEVETAEPVQEIFSLDDNEKNLIIRALSKHNHNRKKAAGELGISERTLYRKIRAYDLE